MKRKAIVLLIIATTAIVFGYTFPFPTPSFQEIYTSVPTETVQSLLTFRQRYPVKRLKMNHHIWNYVVMGEGENTIVFLHGMAGSYDIWWRQMKRLKDQFRLISLTYPPIDNLKELSQGVLRLIEKNGNGEIYLVGSSLGGYLTQYLVARYPHRFKKAVFSNTFPPNDLLEKKNRVAGTIAPFAPQWLIFSLFRKNTEEKLYPASGHSEVLRAYMLEQSYGMMSKSQFIARYHCVIDPFTPLDLSTVKLPVLLIEADNDPLVEPDLREQLRKTYPEANLITLSKVGHFPYLSHPDLYADILRKFFKQR